MSLKRTSGSTPGLGSVTSVVAKMKKTAEQTITIDTPTEVVWAATEFTTDAALISLADDAFVIPSDGYYNIGSMLFWTTAFGAGTSDGYVSIELYVNDGAFSPQVYVTNEHAGWYYTAASGSTIVELSAGDEITFIVRSNVGLVLRNASAQMCVAWMNRL